MAIAFNSTKSTALKLIDKLPFGKFANCRIVDIIDDDYEYLMWLKNNTSIVFSQEVLDKITLLWRNGQEEEYYQNEIAPYLDDMQDDMPF